MVPASVSRHESELGWWEQVSREPHPLLGAHVLSYCGFAETTSGFTVRQEVPWAGVVLIVGFGPPVRIDYLRDKTRSITCTSFVAGLHDEHVLVASSGSQYCMQINLTPLGAYTILGLPMAELANRSVALEDVLGAGAELLVEELRDTRDWDARFDLLDATFVARLAEGRPPAAPVAWAWRRLDETGGRLEIGSLALELGWSRKHLIARFREQIGLPPKTLARVVRFSRAMGLLTSDEPIGLAQIAYRCGYYDQAHLNRDFREFAGATPTDVLSRRLPDGGGIRGDELGRAGVKSVQDVAALTA